MSDLLIRNLDEPLVAALKERAGRNKRSVQQELHSILEEGLRAELAHQRQLKFIELITPLREELAASGRTFSDSTLDIRRDRDTNHVRGFS